jgi:predicted O-methyltransferase YrrM
VNLKPLPDKVRQSIALQYANPVKIDIDQRTHDLRRTSPSESETVILAQLAYSTRPAASLEIGLALAASCVGIAAARDHLKFGRKHVALDPFQKTRSGSVGLLEIERAGFKDSVRWVAEKSEDYLAAAPARRQRYDFIFIDGAHGIGQVVTDAFLCDRVLNSGGVMVFHDGLLFSTLAAVRHLVEECNYSLISLPTDSGFKANVRRVRYLTRLGAWYAMNVIPKMHGSLVALRKP